MKKFFIVCLILLVSFSVFAEWTFGWSIGSASFQELVKDATVKSGPDMEHTNDKVGVGFDCFWDYALNKAISITPSIRVEVPIKYATEETELAHYISAGVGASYTKPLEKGLIRTTVSPFAMFNIKTLKFGYGAKGVLTTDVFINEHWSVLYGGALSFIRIDGKNFCGYDFKAGASVRF